MKTSAGVLVYRITGTDLEVLIAHPGGPFFENKHAGAWTIPKGLIEANEAPEVTARRELAEEVGLVIDAELVSLGEVTQRGGKRILGFAARGDFDPKNLASNLFEIEWPPRSGRRRSFVEVDEVRWVAPEVASELLNPAQTKFVVRLLEMLAVGG